MQLMSCVQGSICFEMMKGVPTGLAALVVGIGGLIIAYNQLKVARTKLELDRYNRDRQTKGENCYNNVVCAALMLNEH
jgi:hypothetical protein